MRGNSPVPVPAVIASWRPRTSEAAAAFAREVVARAEVARTDRARALLFAAAKLGAFGESAGLELSGEALLCEAVIERFICCATRGLSPASKRTLRSNLRALARVQERHPLPAPVALPRERAKPPYRDSEVDGYLHLARAQRTEARRMHASAFVCLGAGAGVIAGELRHLRGSDVSWRSGGLVVVVGGRRARTVPVLHRFCEPLESAARFAGAGYLLGGQAPRRRNLTDALTAALSADTSLPRLCAGRLRSTWLCSCAALIGLPAFMAAAGIRCSQRLGDLVAELPAASEQEIVTLLGGAP
jgi:integrase